MAKSIKKAQVGKKIPSGFKKASASDSTMQKRYPGASPVGKKKPVTDMQRDEMGRPVSPKQKSESLKGLQESVQYKGRPKMKSGGTLSPSKKSVGKTIGKLNKAKSGTSLGMKSVKAGFDKNPGVTRADIIVAGKGQAKKGAKIGAKKMMGGGKCKYGCK